MTRAALATLGIAIAAFTTPGLAAASDPKAETQGPADLTATSATLQANIVLSVLGGSVTWDYGTTTAYGLRTPAVQTALIGVNEKVTVPVTGLTPDTTYHVRVTATALLTVLQGRDVTFKTKKADPRAPSPTAPTTTGTPATTTAPATTAPAPATTTSSSGRSGGDDGPGDDSSSSSRGSGLDDAKVDDDGTDGGATMPPGQATARVAPALGRSVAAAAVAGTIRVTAPAGASADLADARTLPTGTLIDARHGTVELKTALDDAGNTQTARFWGALFQVRQSPTNHGLTQLVLRGANFGACPVAAGTTAHAASTSTRKKAPARSLWGSDDHGKFQTRGRGSVATVRGTRWLTTDTCAGTRTTVLKDAVAVKDLRRGRTVVVTRGHSYLARTTAR